MPDPTARHTAALAALDRLIEIAEAADRSGWLLAVAESSAPERMRSEDDARYLVSVIPDRVLPSLRGRRNILERHAPLRIEFSAEDQDLQGLPPVEYRCRGCGRHWEDCPDWRDAAAGLEVTDG